MSRLFGLNSTIIIINNMSKLVQNYLLQEPIGKGVYGQVFRAIHQKSKEQYAVKVIPKSSFKANPKLQQLAINEINILSSLKNENIVRFIQTLKTPNNFYFVYEYCNGGTLESLLQNKGNLSESEALVIFKQLVDAFKELNKNNIMHRDLKPDNIFFNDGKVKLGDFGFCKMLEVNMAQTMLGSPIYMAPQVLKEEIYTLKADIWSLGVVLFEMLFGYCPFESSSISQLINVIKDTDLKIPKDINPISNECETLINKMLVKDQFKRIEWVDLFQFNIDESGKVVEGYKKDLGIEALQKYFLLDWKGDDGDKKMGLKQEAQKPTLFQSQGIILSSKDIFDNREKVKEKEKDHTMVKKSSLQQVPVISPAKMSIEKETVKDKIESITTLPQAPLPQPPKQAKETFQAKDQLFIDLHGRWLRGVQLLDQLADCGESAEMIFCYVIAVMLKEVNGQYQSHPEWTDVLLQQKRSLNDTLRALGHEDLDHESGKGELLKLWRGGEQRWKMMWARAIRFIYRVQGSQREVEELLV